MMERLTHADSEGNVHMVDTSGKTHSSRRAVAEGFVRLAESHLNALDSLPKGDVFSIAQIAGIMGAKKTSELIPLCHPLALNYVDVQLTRSSNGIRITAEAKTDAQTGVEMEALTAVSIAALTIYDMVKAMGSDITIEGIQLLEKTGGKRDWKRT